MNHFVVRKQGSHKPLSFSWITEDIEQERCVDIRLIALIEQVLAEELLQFFLQLLPPFQRNHLVNAVRYCPAVLPAASLIQPVALHLHEIIRNRHEFRRPDRHENRVRPVRIHARLIILAEYPGNVAKRPQVIGTFQLLVGSPHRQPFRLLLHAGVCDFETMFVCSAATVCVKQHYHGMLRPHGRHRFMRSRPVAFPGPEDIRHRPADVTHCHRVDQAKQREFRAEGIPYGPRTVIRKSLSIIYFTVSPLILSIRCRHHRTEIEPVHQCIEQCLLLQRAPLHADTVQLAFPRRYRISMYLLECQC